MKKEAQKNIIDSFLVWILVMSRETENLQENATLVFSQGGAVAHFFSPP